VIFYPIKIYALKILYAISIKNESEYLARTPAKPPTIFPYFFSARKLS